MGFSTVAGLVPCAINALSRLDESFGDGDSGGFFSSFRLLGIAAGCGLVSGAQSCGHCSVFFLFYFFSSDFLL